MGLIGIFAVTCGGCVNRMFYYPTRDVYGTPASHGLRYEQVSFLSDDGTRLSGWFIPAVGDAMGTVVHFHGNAQNMTAHFSYVAWLPREGFNLFVFDYRGYGASGGSPDREGVYRDCVAALECVRRRADVDPDRIVLLGQSLGGANAIAVAGSGDAGKIRAVAVDSAFFSYRLIVRDQMRHIPLVSLLRWPLSFVIVGNGRSPGPAVANISPTPLLIFHGDEDQVVPIRHGIMLFDAAKEPKEFVRVPGGRHTDAFVRPEPQYRRKLMEFFKESLAATELGTERTVNGKN
jgi:hypothetical protein